METPIIESNAGQGRVFPCFSPNVEFWQLQGSGACTKGLREPGETGKESLHSSRPQGNPVVPAADWCGKLP